MPKNRKHAGGLFLGCTMLGLGVGILVNNVAPFVIIGVGVGFVLQAVFSRLG